MQHTDCFRHNFPSFIVWNAVALSVADRIWLNRSKCFRAPIPDISEDLVPVVRQIQDGLADLREKFEDSQAMLENLQIGQNILQSGQDRLFLLLQSPTAPQEVEGQVRQNRTMLYGQMLPLLICPLDFNSLFFECSDVCLWGKIGRDWCIWVSPTFLDADWRAWIPHSLFTQPCSMDCVWPQAMKKINHCKPDLAYAITFIGRCRL